MCSFSPVCVCRALCVEWVWENNLFVCVRILSLHVYIVLSHARTVRTLGKLNAYFMLYAVLSIIALMIYSQIGKGSALNVWMMCSAVWFMWRKSRLSWYFHHKELRDCAEFVRSLRLRSEWLLVQISLSFIYSQNIPTKHAAQKQGENKIKYLF